MSKFKNDQAGAIRHLTAITHQNRDYAKAQFLLAGLQSDHQQRFDDAIWRFEVVCKNAPDFFLAHFSLARLYQDWKSDSARAKKHYRRVLELEPNFVEARYNLALLLHEDKEYREAEKHFKKCEAAGPKFLSVAVELARFLKEEKNDLKGAEIILEKVLMQDPENTDAKVDLALILTEEDPFRAKDLFEEALVEVKKTADHKYIEEIKEYIKDLSLDSDDDLEFDSKKPKSCCVLQ
eukprot:TRINITY_DN4395_c0_g1_i1.p1 TRINITY_DN4395_c0_g1~~TRINITY_DN4395_c0_g1_i1.p1  ORF type:complete len:236 (-),score=51.43 TRINITY_DN4395_c0_g1_i1:102-809(-)